MVDMNLLEVNRIVVKKVENKVLAETETPYQYLDIDIYTANNGKISLTLFSSDDTKIDIVDNN